MYVTKGVVHQQQFVRYRPNVNLIRDGVKDIVEKIAMLSQFSFKGFLRGDIANDDQNVFDTAHFKDAERRFAVGFGFVCAKHGEFGFRRSRVQRLFAGILELIAGCRPVVGLGVRDRGKRPRADNLVSGFFQEPEQSIVAGDAGFAVKNKGRVGGSFKDCVGQTLCCRCRLDGGLFCRC